MAENEIQEMNEYASSICQIMSDKSTLAQDAFVGIMLGVCVSYLTHRLGSVFVTEAVNQIISSKEVDVSKVLDLYHGTKH